MIPGRLQSYLLSVAALLLLACASPPTSPSGERPPFPPPQAFGVSAPPATSGQAPATLWSDLGASPKAISSDLVHVWSTPHVWLALVAANLGGQALDLVGVEQRTTDFFARHTVLPAGSSAALGQLGTGYVLLSGAGAMYLWSSNAGDEQGLAASKLLLRSLATTGISTIALKSIFNDERPNGGTKGYPSGHTSMSVTAATSLWYSFGPKAGMPAALLAGLVALQRLDSRAHELDDVIGGAVLGWIMAATLAEDEPPKILGATLLPAPSASGDPGFSLLWSY